MDEAAPQDPHERAVPGLPTPVWVGGSVVDASTPSLRADDTALLSGLGVFEAVEVDHGHLVLFDRHLDRLEHSARIVGISTPPRPLIRQAVVELWGALEDQRPDAAPHAVARIMLTGAGAMVITWRPWPDRAQPSAVTTSPFARNEHSAVAGAKTISYAEAAVAAAEAARHGADEAILLNTGGELCEGTTSNVFVVLDDRLVTPPASSGLLRGVTRELLLEHSIGAEVTIPGARIGEITEAFLTSTSRRVHPIATWDGRALDVDGPHTREARDCWSAIRRQFG